MPKQVRWARAWLEGLVIVVSILLAFGIEAWWGQRQNRAHEVEILAALGDELNANGVALAESIEFNEDRLALIARFLAASASDLSAVHPDSVSRLVMGLPNAPTFDPQVAAAELLAETPVASPEGIRLKSWTDTWMRGLVLTGRAGELLRERHDRVQEELVRHVSEEAMRTPAPLADAVAKSGPDVLAELRVDRHLLDAVLLKRHTQEIYLLRLRDLQILLASSAQRADRAGLN